MRTSLDDEDDVHALLAHCETEEERAGLSALLADNRGGKRTKRGAEEKNAVRQRIKQLLNRRGH